MGFVDQGLGGTDQPVAALLKHGNAGSNTAADGMTVTEQIHQHVPKVPASTWAAAVETTALNPPALSP
ncbi:hypothetical protein GA0115249_110428, partial [Streptomyces sp. PpalLS-921]